MSRGLPTVANTIGSFNGIPSPSRVPSSYLHHLLNPFPSLCQGSEPTFRGTSRYKSPSRWDRNDPGTVDTRERGYRVPISTIREGSTLGLNDLEGTVDDPRYRTVTEYQFPREFLLQLHNCLYPHRSLYRPFHLWFVGLVEMYVRP